MSKKSQFINLLSISVILVFALVSFANAQIPLLVKGKIVDEFTGKPVICTIEFRTDNGKKIKITTQEDGLYQQVLTSGSTYEVYLYNWDVLRKSENYTVPDLDDFQEVNKDFKVKKLEKGNKVFDLNFFDNTSSILNGSSEEFLKELNTIMRFNRHVQFAFHINAHDSYSKSNSKIKSLVEKRKATLSEKLSKYPMIKERVSIIIDESKPSGKPDNSYPDVIVTVSQIENKLK
jgi:ribosomal protein L21E